MVWFSGYCYSCETVKQREGQVGMSIIQNFGFMWDRSEVDWGRRGPGGRASFRGVKVGNTKRIVDFQEQMGIYVLYDRFEQPVQIGQAQVIFVRLRQHRADHLRNRWAYFTWFGFYKVSAAHQLLAKEQAIELKKVTTLGEALHEIEAVLIQVMEPRLNRRGPNWKDTEEYLQVRKSDDDNDDEDDNLAEEEK
jgi:hypothetical protein